MRAQVTLLILASILPLAVAAEDAERPVAVTTTSGSRLLGMLDNARPCIFRTDPAAGKPKGPPQKLNLADARLITFGERHDPNLENEALVALGDLQSEKFNVREAALKKLRSLGRAAIRPLKTASHSADAEVANRARSLLGEMSIQNAARIFGDCVTQADGTMLVGEFAPPELIVRTRWGVLKFPIRCLESIEFLKLEQVDAKPLAAAGTEAVPVEVRQAAAGVDGAGTERIENLLEFMQGGAAGRNPRALAGLTSLPMDRVPNPDAKEASKKRTVEVKAGDRLEDAYANWGVLLRPSDPNAGIEVSEEVINGLSGGLSAKVGKSDLIIDFVVPKSYSPRIEQSRPGGVAVFGVVIKECPRFSVGLAAFDRAGRQLAEIQNVGSEIPGRPPGVAVNGIGEFLGVRSKVPIARVRLFRMPEAQLDDLVIDDIIFDRIVSVERPAGNSCAWLASGERIAGQLAAASGGKIALRPEFLKANNAAVEVALETVERIEPSREAANPATQAPLDGARKRPALGTPHGVLLQSGESFRACFLKLNETEVLFMLPGGVEMKLPRTTLRKIDLAPPAPEPGEISAPTAVADDEKPGVDFVRKDDPKKSDAKDGAEKNPDGPPDDKKTKDVLQTTQALKRMDDVKILEADIIAGELTTEDADGPWTIGIAPVRTLVFPKDPNAQKAAPQARGWLLTLREGSSFEIALKSITPEAITAEMAGGTVSLPLHVIDSIVRVRR